MIKRLVFVWLSMMLCGCGGGGGGSEVKVTPQAKTAILTLSTSAQGTPFTGALSGIGVSVKLPAGTTVKVSGGVVDPAVVTVSSAAGPGMVTPPEYHAPTATQPGHLKFVIANTTSSGIPVGDFAIVQCAVPAGSVLTAQDFTLSDFAPANMSLQPVTVLAVSATLSMHD